MQSIPMNDMNTISTYEGKQDHILNLKTPVVETFKNIYADSDYLIEFSIPEFTAVCPKTGLPDFGTIEISYKPNLVCIELKSLKEYMLFYRNIGIFHENVVNKILDDLVLCVDPVYMKVRGDYNIRGGIKTVVTKEYKK